MRRFARGRGVSRQLGELRKPPAEVEAKKQPVKPRESINFNAEAVADWSTEEPDVTIDNTGAEKSTAEATSVLDIFDRTFDGKAFTFHRIQRNKPAQLPAGSHRNLQNLCSGSQVRMLELRDNGKFTASYKDGTTVTVGNCNAEAFDGFYRVNTAAKRMTILSCNANSRAWECSKKLLTKFLAFCQSLTFTGSFDVDAVKHFLSSLTRTTLSLRFTNWCMPHSQFPDLNLGDLRPLLRTFPTLQLTELFFDAVGTDTPMLVDNVSSLWQSGFKCNYLSLAICDWENFDVTKVNLIRIRSMVAQEAVIMTDVGIDDSAYSDLLRLGFQYAGTTFKPRGIQYEKYHLMDWVGDIHIVIAFRDGSKMWDYKDLPVLTAAMPFVKPLLR